MYDILKNHRIELLRAAAAQQIGAAVVPTVGYFDMWENGQLPNRALVIVHVTSVGTGGTLSLAFQDCTTALDGTYDADFGVAATISATGLFLIDLVDFYRWLRCMATVAGDAVSWSGFIMTFEDQRRPVTQSGTTQAVTYGSGRSPKVATS